MSTSTGHMTFLVEHYWPGVTADRFEHAAEQVRRGAEAMTQTGTRVRFLHSTFVPEDEAAFCVFEAESQAGVEAAYSRAGVAYERIVSALEIALEPRGRPRAGVSATTVARSRRNPWAD